MPCFGVSPPTATPPAAPSVDDGVVAAPLVPSTELVMDPIDGLGVVATFASWTRSTLCWTGGSRMAETATGTSVDAATAAGGVSVTASEATVSVSSAATTAITATAATAAAAASSLGVSAAAAAAAARLASKARFTADAVGVDAEPDLTLARVGPAASDA